MHVQRSGNAEEAAEGGDVATSGGMRGGIDGAVFNVAFLDDRDRRVGSQVTRRE
jgi:hypothetical protein